MSVDLQARKDEAYERLILEALREIPLFEAWKQSKTAEALAAWESQRDILDAAIVAHRIAREALETAQTVEFEHARL